MEATREEVFGAISSERDYQIECDNTSSIAFKDKDKAIAHWLLYMEKHLSQAKDAIYYHDRHSALRQIKTIAAFATACLEHKGLPRT